MIDIDPEILADQLLQAAAHYGATQSDPRQSAPLPAIDPKAEIERLTTEGRPWIPMSAQQPPDTSSYAIRSMYLMCNDGFVTIGFWYPKAKEWHDTGGINVTSQVSHWKKLPEAPASGSQS